MATHSKFLWYLTSKWGRDVPLKTLWTIHFTDISRIAQNVSNILYSAENVNNNRKWPVLDFESDQDAEQGLVIAQSVALPSNSFSIERTSNLNHGGLRAGYIGGQRNVYNEVAVEFLETNIDIIDHFFRPWIIAASHKGLIEDGDARTDIKGDMYVTMYSRVNRDRLLINTLVPEWEIRKTFMFTGVTPTEIGGSTLKMSDFSISDVIHNVGFTFSDYYIVTDPLTNTIPGSRLDS